MGERPVLVVRLGELDVARAPAVLTSYGLGSCLGLALYDPQAKVGGLAHVMLPDSRLSRLRASDPGKFADTALPELVRRMTEAGAAPARLKAKLVGGAHMFGAVYGPARLVGPRNVEAARGLLAARGIEIVASAVGGVVGRTVEFFTEDGKLVVRTAHAESREL